MDFRRDMSKPFEPPFQPSVSKYTDNYIMLMSASKIFSYAGQRIAMACISDKLYERHYDSLKERYGIPRFGAAYAYIFLYTFSSGVSHSAQYAMAAMLYFSLRMASTTESAITGSTLSAISIS